MNKAAWAVATLTGLIALASAVVSVLGGHAILIALGSAAGTVVAALLARTAQASHEDRAYRL